MSTATPNPTAYCRSCGRGLTEETVREVGGKIYCESCITARMEGAAATADKDKFDHAADKVEDAVKGASKVADAAVRAAMDSPPSVGLATFLGFIPGAGAMYNGQFMKAFAHIVIFFSLASAIDNLSEFFVPIFLAFWAYMAVDANKTAKARLLGIVPPDYLGLNTITGSSAESSWTGAPASASAASVDASDPAKPQPPVGAIVLIGLGVLFLLRNVLDLPFRFLNHYWPLFIVGFGLWLAQKRWNSRKTVYLGDMMGAVVVTTIGFLMLLNELTYSRVFHNLWPVMLIVIGGVKLLGGTVLKQAQPGQDAGTTPADSGNQGQ